MVANFQVGSVTSLFVVGDEDEDRLKPVRVALEVHGQNQLPLLLCFFAFFLLMVVA